MQTSRIEYALPQAMVTSLQAITSRSTQDLWGTPATTPGDLTVEQQAQKRAAAVSKLSKRLTGDLRAKEELKTSLQSWLGTIGQHLAGLAQRARALGDKIDGDLAEACGEMQSALTLQPSLATSEQVSTAKAAIGAPIWTPAQEREILHIAASLRAVSVVEPPAPLADHMSDLSFGTGAMQSFAAALPASLSHSLATHPGPSTGTMEVATAAPLRNAGRWRKREGPRTDRPSKSPRRDLEPEAPWPRLTTGLTPEAVRRPATVNVAEDVELLPETARETAALDWFSSWLRLVGYMVEHGDVAVGDLARHVEQDAVLPLTSDMSIAGALAVNMQEVWSLLLEVVKTGNPRQMQRLYSGLGSVLQQ